MPLRVRSARGRTVAACVAAALVIAPLAWLWQVSRLPGSYGMTSVGYADTGGAAAGHAHNGVVDVTTLVADPQRRADVVVTLTARHQRFQVGGHSFDGYVLNGTSPGPVIRAVQGQLVEVRLVNESVREGVTLHWHGVDVPNAADGVAGVTQDAVRVGETYTYRFVADQAGTFWYHSHQASNEQVKRGLLGALVVVPAQRAAQRDVVALVHQYGSVRTVDGQPGDLRVPLPPGETARVRVINSENGPMSAWVAGAACRLVAVDGTDLTGPTAVRDTAVLVTAGGRADLEVQAPADGTAVRVHLGGPHGVLLGGSGSAGSAGAAGTVDPPPVAKPKATVDLLTYGTPASLAFDPDRPDRRFRYDIGRRPGFLAGRPGMWWTINGHIYPDVPMFVVAEGDVVRMTISNHSGEVHPMHLHGHHAVVFSRNGVPATGSRWWVDSLDVANGETYEIAFVADNPGIWMDHCHNLPHAAQGLVTHLMYEGVSSPFEIGGSRDNEPE
jgi:FtsP/CotA-like multicopper oxidase with cupredoxin domain